VALLLFALDAVAVVAGAAASLIAISTSAAEFLLSLTLIAPLL
jgi:hypothetical protein